MDHEETEFLVGSLPERAIGSHAYRGGTDERPHSGGSPRGCDAAGTQGLMQPCLRCGANLTAEARYCACCGAPAAQVAGPASWPGAAADLHKGRPRLLSLGLVGIVVALIVGVGFWRSTGDGPANAAALPPATPLSGVAIVGATHEVGTETSEPGQDTTLRVPADGPLAGMTIEIPGDAYAEQTSFTVSAKDLRLTGYDGKIAALTDLVVVENGGAYAASPMTVTIPVAIPAGFFAMGVYLRDNGKLEPMPLVEETPTSVTLLSRHFSTFFVAAIARAALPENIGTGFRAGDDDIQAANYGSYLAPNGYCDGQSLAEMWYFDERRSAGAPPLWGLTDNNGKGETTSFWEDDSNAYRLGSMIHWDTDYDTVSATIELAFEKAKVDQLQWDAFRYAMLITGQPQFVGLSVGDDPGGHVVVAYAATRTGLWVADPNFPGKLRDIAWDEAARGFKPYDSGRTALSSKEHYDRIAFYGKTALVDWNLIGARWSEVDAGTIGQYRFPTTDLEIMIRNPNGTLSFSDLHDGPLATASPELGVKSVAGSPDVRAWLYDGTRLIYALYPGITSVINLEGVRDLGVYFEAMDKNGDWRAVNFRHYNLTASPLPSPTPAPSAEPASAPPSPTPPPSAKPTPPAPNPTSSYDCTKGPPASEIGRMEWMLHCQGIEPGTSP